MASASAEPRPPSPARHPVSHTIHGITRTDDYAWLRADNWRDVVKDPSLLAPEIRAHIDAENRYSDAALAHLAGLRARLLDDMKGRIEQDDSGVPVPCGPYAYWRKFVAGAEHPQLMRGGRDGSNAQVLVDGAKLAAGKAYFSFGSYEASPDHRLFAYMTDDTGAERYALHIRDIASGQDIPDVLTDVSGFAWVPDAGSLFYVGLDDEHRSRFVYRHHVGSAQSEDVLIYEEQDPGFEVSIFSQRTQKHLVISTGNLDSSESWLIDTAKLDAPPMLVAARKAGRRYFIEDWGDRFSILTNADGAFDFKVMTAPQAAPGIENWHELIAHKPGRQIISIYPLADYLIRHEQEDGLPRIVIRERQTGTEHAITFSEEAYTIGVINPNDFDTRTLQFSYNSPATPMQTFDYALDTRERTLRKQQRIPSGHDPAAYTVRRLFATARDGAQVPITLFHRKDQALDGSAPLFLEGYGAYAYTFNAEFSSNVVSLVDQGFIYAIAHIRGGLDKGFRWRDGGRLGNKPNSFTDFIAVAEHLAHEHYTSAGRIVARGDSAGGLLMGAVANMRPDLFAGIIARVPFVDALNTMLDDSLPLTVSDRPEWGDPIADLNAYRTIAGYSPYDNVKPQAYPPMLVTAGISDPRVTYWEPAKWVAELRATKTDDHRITLVTRMSAGHHGAAGRFEWLEEVALIHAFALDSVGKGMERRDEARTPQQLDKVIAPASQALDLGFDGRLSADPKSQTAGQPQGMPHGLHRGH